MLWEGNKVQLYGYEPCSAICFQAILSYCQKSHQRGNRERGCRGLREISVINNHS